MGHWHAQQNARVGEAWPTRKHALGFLRGLMDGWAEGFGDTDVLDGPAFAARSRVGDAYRRLLGGEQSVVLGSEKFSLLECVNGCALEREAE